MSNFLGPNGLQHARPSCPSPTPRVHLNSCPLSRWCHSAISSSVIPFSCLQSFPASSSFQMSQFFASGRQSIGVSVSALVLPMNIQDWFPLGWTGCISFQSKGLARVFSNTTVQKHRCFSAQISLIVQLSHPYMTTGKNIALTRWIFFGKVMPLFSTCWYVAHNFSSKEQASFNFMAAVTICSDFGVQKNKVCLYFHCFPIYLPWSDGTGCHECFLNVEC